MLYFKAKNFIMKKNISLSGIFIIVVLLFSSCETEIDLVGKGEEKVIVYGIFNIKDSIHYLKINKTFNGDGDAYQMAKVEDSTLIKNIEVLVNNINFDTVSIYSKKSGIFNNPKQTLYKNYAPIYFESGTTIRLKVKDWQTNKEIIATTTLVDSLKPDEFEGPHPNNIVNNYIYLKWEDPYQSVTWKRPNNAYIIQIRFLINYIEVDENNNITEHHAPWYIGETASLSKSTWQKPLLKYLSRDMYFAMKNYIPQKPNVTRYFGTKNNPNRHFTVQLLAADKSLYEYIKLNNLPVSDYSNQEMYLYTNIKGGLGMIGSYSISERHHLFSPATADSIITNPYTSNLNFQRPVYP